MVDCHLTVKPKIKTTPAAGIEFTSELILYAGSPYNAWNALLHKKNKSNFAN